MKEVAIFLTSLITMVAILWIATPKDKILFYQNLDALLQNEIIGTAGTGKCYKSISDSENEFVLYCGTCTYLPGHHTLFSGTDECE